MRQIHFDIRVNEKSRIANSFKISTDQMDQFLETVSRKGCLWSNASDEQAGVRHTVLQDTVPSKESFDLIVNFVRRLVESRTKTSSEIDFTDFQKFVLEVEHLQNVISQQRAEFTTFLPGIKGNSESISSLDAKGRIMARLGQLFVMVLTKSKKNERRIGCLQMEVESFKLRLKDTTDKNCSIERNLRDACVESKKRCSNCLARYDNDIGALYSTKNDLEMYRDLIKKEQTDLQYRLTAQRALHRQLKEQHEIFAMNAFLNQLENFRRNHAAKVIQKKWRMHWERVSTKKKKLRK